MLKGFREFVDTTTEVDRATVLLRVRKTLEAKGWKVQYNVGDARVIAQKKDDNEKMHTLNVDVIAPDNTIVITRNNEPTPTMHFDTLADFATWLDQLLDQPFTGPTGGAAEMPPEAPPESPPEMPPATALPAEVPAT